MRFVRAALIVFLVFGAAACLDDSITGVRDLAIELEVSPASAMVDDSITASWVATGSGLQGVIVDWGDGLLDSIPLGGFAVEAEQLVRHAYAVSGTFTITARAEDQTGFRSASATVEIN